MAQPGPLKDEAKEHFPKAPSKSNFCCVCGLHVGEQVAACGFHGELFQQARPGWDCPFFSQVVPLNTLLEAELHDSLPFFRSHWLKFP